MQLEVLDLEICHFVQYRPPNPPFEPMELNVTVVKRNREWFEENLPLFQKFISDLDRFKKEISDLSDKYPSEDKKEKIPQRKRLKNDDTPFLIQDKFEPRPKCLVLDT